jgi:hypothetical protein
VAVQTNLNIDLDRIRTKIIEAVDHEPEIKARIAQALWEMDNEQDS